MKLLIMKLIYKIIYLLYKLFPKHIPILSCYGCLYGECSYRPKKGNMICYYHTKKNREVKTLVDLMFLQEELAENGSDEE